MADCFSSVASRRMVTTCFVGSAGHSFGLESGSIAAVTDPENATHAMNAEVRSIAGVDMDRRNRIANK
jgi:hypothetical protein